MHRLAPSRRFTRRVTRRANVAATVAAAALLFAGCTGRSNADDTPPANGAAAPTTVADPTDTADIPPTPPDASADPTDLDADLLDLTVVDDSRPTPAVADVAELPQRTLDTDLYLPQQSEPRPLIVLAHGFDGHPDKFSDLATAWRDAGYVVAVPRFPVTADDAAVVDGSALTQRLADLSGQVGDVQFLLDWLLDETNAQDHRFAGRIDSDHVGYYGLSYGSFTVWDAWFDAGSPDERVDALIQSDGGSNLTDEQLGSVPIPILVSHSDGDTTLPYDNARRIFDALGSPKYLFTTHGHPHAMVGENTETNADEAYRQVTTAFWNRHLSGDEQAEFPDSVVIEGVTSLEAG